ncbi:MAG: hypothetical protein ACMXYD_02355 [Candidatus Woesearchaeota archaeon]
MRHNLSPQPRSYASGWRRKLLWTIATAAAVSVFATACSSQYNSIDSLIEKEPVSVHETFAPIDSLYKQKPVELVYNQE